jgi:hypothetical protein
MASILCGETKSTADVTAVRPSDEAMGTRRVPGFSTAVESQLRDSAGFSPELRAPTGFLGGYSVVAR